MIAAVKARSLGLPQARAPPARESSALVLFLHNRYRTLGGEERAVDDLAWLVREHLGEPVELLERDSAALGARGAAVALLRGGAAPEEVGAAVARTGARIVHAHNLNPAFGPRALAAARAAGAKVVLHLHNYRLVCAVGTCVDPLGEDCTRCGGRDTRPGVRLGCRGSRAEGAVYAAALARHSGTLVEHADAVVVPSAAALARLRELRAPLGGIPVHVVPHAIRALDRPVPAAPAGDPRGPALVASRLAHEKAVDVAIDACALAGLPLVIAGDGPERARLEARAAGHDVRFAGRVTQEELARLRAEASVALAPTRAQETFGLAALEAMAAGLPTVATARGALAELAGGALLAPPDDPAAFAAAITAARSDPDAGPRARAMALRLAAPEEVAPRLAAVYDSL